MEPIGNLLGWTLAVTSAEASRPSWGHHAQRDKDNSVLWTSRAIRTGGATIRVSLDMIPTGRGWRRRGCPLLLLTVPDVLRPASARALARALVDAADLAESS